MEEAQKEYANTIAGLTSMVNLLREEIKHNGIFII